MLKADKLRADIEFIDPVEHGGDLAAIEAAFPAAPRPWIDLSTGINPWPYPVGRLPPAAWRRLPSTREEQALREAAAQFYGGRSADDVVLAPGSQALIPWLPRLRARTPWRVPGPMLAIAGRALSDRTWIRRARVRFGRATQHLDRLAGRGGLDLVGGTSLFRLYRSPRAPEIFARLAASGIYVRRFAADPTWLRLGLAPHDRALRRLARAPGA